MSGYELVPADLLNRAQDWQEAETAMATARASLASLGGESFNDTVASAVTGWVDAWVEHATMIRDAVDRAGYTLEQNARTYSASDTDVATGFTGTGPR